MAADATRGAHGMTGDLAALRTAVDALAGRFRSLPESRLRRAAPAGLALARELSAAGQRLEAADREPLTMPDEGGYPVGDQIAVAGFDLAAALEAHTARGPERDALCGQALRALAETARLL